MPRVNLDKESGISPTLGVRFKRGDVEAIDRIMRHYGDETRAAAVRRAVRLVAGQIRKEAK